MKKEDPNWLTMVQSDATNRIPRSVPPQRGKAQHPDRAMFKEREKELPKLPSRECTWAGPDAKRYHPHILEAAPKFTNQARQMWSPYTRKAPLIGYNKTQEDQQLEHLCARPRREGALMTLGIHGKSISDPIAGWTAGW